jgi:hypothetical protein
MILISRLTCGKQLSLKILAIAGPVKLGHNDEFRSVTLGHYDESRPVKLGYNDEF